MQYTHFTANISVNSDARKRIRKNYKLITVSKQADLYDKKSVNVFICTQKRVKTFTVHFGLEGEATASFALRKDK